MKQKGFSFRVEQTCYRWKQRDGGLEADQVRQFNPRQDETAKRKQ